MTDDNTDLLDHADTFKKDAELSATYRIDLYDHELTTLFDIETDDITQDYAKDIARKVAHAAIQDEYGINVGTPAQTVVEADDPVTESTGLTCRTFTVAVVGVSA